MSVQQDSVQSQSGAQQDWQIAARLERLPISWWHLKLRIIVGFATFFEAFDILAIVYVVPVLAGLWKLSPAEIGLLFSSGFLGQLIGAVFFGWLAEKIGRRRVVAITVLLFSVMSLACAFAWSYASLLVFRFIQGLGLGGEMPVASAYISEFAKAEGRGRFFLLYELIFPVGLVFAALAGVWVVPNLGWQYMFVLGAIPAFLAFFLRWLLPESPRWLASRGRMAEADRVVSEIEQSVSRGGAISLPPIVPITGEAANVRPAYWRDLFRGMYGARTMSVWAFFFLAYLLGYGLTTWLPTIYRTVFQVGVQEALTYGLIMQIGGLIANTMCALLIDKVGRRPWLIMAFMCAATPLIVLWLSGANTLMPLVVAGTLSYCFQATIALTLYLYTPEIYPTHMRAIGTSIGSAWLRAAAFVGPNIVGFVLPIYGIGVVCLLFGLIAVLGGVVAILYAVETKGKVLEKLSPWPA